MPTKGTSVSSKWNRYTCDQRHVEQLVVVEVEVVLVEEISHLLVWLRESTHWTVLEVVVDGRVDATSFTATRVDKARAGDLNTQ